MTTTTTRTSSPSRTARNVALGVGYLALAALGVALLATAADRLLGLLSGILLLLVAVAGFVLVGFDAWYPRHRAGVVVAAAPSGAVATAFPRSKVPMAMSTVLPAALAAWGVLGCILAAAADEPVAAVVLALVAVGVATPLVAVVRGQVAPGGLYLTPAGIEHRKEAVTWSLRWEDVTGVVPGAPLAVLRTTAPQLRTTTRVLWQREPSGPPGVQAVDSRYLAEDDVVVAAVIARCIAHPEQRARMGTEAAVAEIVATRAR